MERLALDRWASPWLRNQHLARYRWSSRFARGGRVLDAACGTAYGSRLMRDEGARHVTSADLSVEAFAAARRAAGASAFHFVRADVTSLPLADASYDLYTCFETVEHVEADADLVSEARRVLRPGGLFVCSTPNRNLLSPGNSLRDRPENPYHVREYAIEEFHSLLEASFASVELFGQTWFSAAHRDRLARAGERGNHFAVRLHQLRNILGVWAERPERHEPRPLGEGRGVPEVVIGLCRA